MEVRLVVLAGAKRGTKIRVSHRHFFIGRSDDCHLRPASAAVSRHHCLLLTGPQAMMVCDLGSESGTFVNDRPVTGKCQLVAGDRLRVGPIDFQVEVSSHHVSTPEQETLVQGAHPTTTTKAIGDSAVHDWLGLEASTSKTNAGQDGHGKVNIAAHDTIALTADKSPVTSPSAISDSGAHKRVVGKLPPRPFIANTDSSQSAAEEMLKKLQKKKS